MSSISVVTASYNAAPLLAQAVRSVAAQSVPVHQHIIVDDGSSDGTRELIEELGRAIPHLLYIRQNRSGAAGARNAGIEAATGRYIAFLDSDDMWSPGKLEVQTDFMRESGAVLSYGDYVAVRDTNGRVCAVHRPPDRVRYEDLLLGCPIGCLTAAYDQEAIGKAYMPNFRRGQDWGLWLAITRQGVVAQKYPGLAAEYRVRSGSLSRSKVSKSVDMYRIYREQEGLGTARSLVFLARHCFGIIQRSAGKRTAT